MERRKLKLLASLTSLVLVIAILAVGVWAATNATVSINGTVNYTASGNIKATIILTENGETSTVTPTVSGGADGSKPVATAGSLVFNGAEEANLTGSFTLGEDGTINLTSTEGQATDVEYYYTLTIKNDYTEADSASKKSLQVVFTLPPVSDNVEVTTDDVGDNTWTDNTSTRTITLAPEETATITIKFTTNPNVSVTSCDIGSSFALSIM